jgi:peptidoglycan/LPS O-acetylase OafA/YrhL
VLTILFHGGVSRLAGGFIGVDVFFVISGFLMTGIITKPLLAPKRDRADFSLVGFYSNRARRLLPAAFVTIAVTTVLTYVVLPASRFDSISRDGLASAYYGINWRLADQAVDYLAQQQAPSPFQHFWSLAVEEQFYILWPLLLLLAAAAVPRVRRRAAFAVALALVFVPSLAYSITETSANPGRAYFVTPTRMWELALGGALALAAPWLGRIPKRAALVIGWIGLAAIGYAAVEYTGSTPFPGYTALLPTVATALIIAVGQGAGRFGVGTILSLRPVTFIGDISYSLYLWHWPLIVFVAHHYDDKAPVWAGLAAGFGAIIPAYLSYRFVEQPAIAARDRGATAFTGLRLGFICTGSAAIAAALLLLAVPTAHTNIAVAENGQARDTTTDQIVKIGAETLTGKAATGSPRDSFRDITPDPINAEKDLPVGGRCIVLELASTDEPCTFGDETSSTEIDLIGDSHAMQWQPGLAAAATAAKWRLVTHTKQECPLNAQPTWFEGKHSYPQCTAWNKNVLREVLAAKPALVIVSSEPYYADIDGRQASFAESLPAVAAGYRAVWDTLTTAGIKVAVLADSPRPGYDIVGCVESNRTNLSECARPRSSMLTSKNESLKMAVQADTNVTGVDLNRYICPTANCAAVIGSALVYRDNNHLSATYVTSMHAQIESAVRAALRA